MTVLNYQEDLQEMLAVHFSTNNIDMPWHFPNGLFYGSFDIPNVYINFGTGQQLPDQPDAGDNIYWGRFKIRETIVSNSTISDGITQKKRMVTFVDCTVYWPQTLTKKRLINEIEPALDAVFLNKKFISSDGKAELYSQQDIPKDTIDSMIATGGSQFNIKTIRYAYVVNFN